MYHFYFQLSFYSRGCDNKWRYTGFTTPEQICCEKQTPVPCNNYENVKKNLWNILYNHPNKTIRNNKANRKDRKFSNRWNYLWLWKPLWSLKLKLWSKIYVFSWRFFIPQFICCAKNYCNGQKMPFVTQIKCNSLVEHKR